MIVLARGTRKLFEKVRMDYVIYRRGNKPPTSLPLLSQTPLVGRRENRAVLKGAIVSILNGEEISFGGDILKLISCNSTHSSMLYVCLYDTRAEA